MTGKSSNRLAHLDGIRGLAILAVLAVHWVGLRNVIGMRGGYLGVDAFFVLSGFIITRQLVTKNVPYRIFIYRRVKRLYPALLSMVLVFTLLGLIFSSAQKVLPGAALAVIQGMSIARAIDHYVGDPFGSTWSLAIEWYFYAVWPLIVLSLRHRRRAATICLAAAAGLYSASLLLSPYWFYYGPTARFAELLVGAASAFSPLRTRKGTHWVAAALLALCLVWVVLGPAEVAFSYRTLGLPVVVAATVTSIAAGSEPGRLHQFLGRFAPLGRISYSLYLWQWLPVAAITAGLGSEGFAIALVLTAVGTWLSYRYLELPFLRSPIPAQTRPEPAKAVIDNSPIHLKMLAPTSVHCQPIDSHQ